MVRKAMGSQRKERKRFLSWLPAIVVAGLSITMVVQSSVANRSPQQGKSHKTRSFESYLLQRGLPSDLAPAVRDGIWNVEGSVWSFENDTISTQQLTQVLRSRNTAEQGSDMDEHVALLDLIPAQICRVERDGAFTTRSLAFDNVRASVCYRVAAGRKYFVSARVANRMDADRWQLITLTPKTADSGNRQHILPIDRTATVVCQRAAKTGTLQCEILETERSIDELVKDWSREGWFAQPLPATGIANCTVWSCEKGEQTVHVQATPNPTKSTQTIVVTALHNL